MTAPTSPFCGKCGASLRALFRGKSVIRKCPKCHPEPVGTGIPCHDGRLCRPERCVIGLECKEGKR